MTDQTMTRAEPLRLLLLAEFLALYIAAPVALWVFLPYLNLYAAIAGTMLVGLFLLWRTPGFRWRELIDFSSMRGWWGLLAAMALVSGVVIFAVAWSVLDTRFMQMARERPQFLAVIWMLYPWFSVLGQEVLFRPLFFHRYARLFPSETVAVVVNALVFALAHAFFERWITFLMTLGGGLLFAHFYAKSRSFPGVFILHWIAGGLVFTSGLGWFFYHGAIGR